MKALTLWQPWASLVAVGAKRIETRHWPAPGAVVGQRIAIHAAVRRTDFALVHDEPFRTALAGISRDPNGNLPTGVIVATAVLDRCQQMDPGYAARLLREHPTEHAFGHYAPGRYAWHLTDAEQLEEPVLIRGAQGFWTVPAGVLA